MEVFAMRSPAKGNGRRWQTACRSLLVAMALATCPAGANAQQGSPGITQRTVFPAFDPNAPACTPPPDLSRVLTFVQENEREFLQGVDHGLSQAAKDRETS